MKLYIFRGECQGNTLTKQSEEEKTKIGELISEIKGALSSD